MPDSGSFPTFQNDPSAAIPVAIVQNGAFAGGQYKSTPLGYQQITSLTSATNLAVPAGATYCYISVEGTAVRFRDDGTAPTAAVGFPLPANTSNFLYSGNLAAIQFIQQSASATIDVLYYK